MMRLAFLAILAVTSITSASAQQPCNPIIDGTYCATQMPRKPSASAVQDSRFAPMQGISSDFAGERDQPGTLGAISFRGAERCIGLLRRSACN